MNIILILLYIFTYACNSRLALVTCLTQQILHMALAWLCLSLHQGYILDSFLFLAHALSFPYSYSLSRLPSSLALTLSLQ